MNPEPEHTEGRVNENESSNALEQDPFRFQPVALLPSVPA